MCFSCQQHMSSKRRGAVRSSGLPSLRFTLVEVFVFLTSCAVCSSWCRAASTPIDSGGEARSERGLRPIWYVKKWKHRSSWTESGNEGSRVWVEKGSLFAQALVLVFAQDRSFQAEVVQLMKEYDRNQAGTICYEAFAEIMHQKIINRDPEEELRKAFSLFDEDKTGTISFKDLKRVARELVPLLLCFAWRGASFFLNALLFWMPYPKGEVLSEEELHAMIEEFDQVYFQKNTTNTCHCCWHCSPFVFLEQWRRNWFGGVQGNHGKIFDLMTQWPASSTMQHTLSGHM